MKYGLPGIGTRIHSALVVIGRCPGGRFIYFFRSNKKIQSWGSFKEKGRNIFFGVCIWRFGISGQRIFRKNIEYELPHGVGGKFDKNPSGRTLFSFSSISEMMGLTTIPSPPICYLGRSSNLAQSFPFFRGSHHGKLRPKTNMGKRS